MFKDKSKQIQEVADNISLYLFGRKTSTSIDNNICVDCGESAEKFDNEISKREYQISGLCQKCQDLTFGKDKLE